jgi:hypothetical protein
MERRLYAVLDLPGSLLQDESRPCDFRIFPDVAFAVLSAGVCLLQESEAHLLHVLVLHISERYPAQVGGDKIPGPRASCCGTPPARTRAQTEDGAPTYSSSALSQRCGRSCSSRVRWRSSVSEKTSILQRRQCPTPASRTFLAKFGPDSVISIRSHFRSLNSFDKMGGHDELHFTRPTPPRFP